MTFHSIEGGEGWKRTASTGYKPDETGLAATVERSVAMTECKFT